MKTNYTEPQLELMEIKAGDPMIVSEDYEDGDLGGDTFDTSDPLDGPSMN